MNQRKIIHPAPPEALELGAFDQPITSSHGCYGPCPECKSLHTIVRSQTPIRVCLTCGFAEEFLNQDQAMTGWRNVVPLQQFPKPTIYCELKPPSFYKQNGD